MSRTGEISVTARSLSPVNAIIGVAFGQIQGNSCVVLSQNSIVVQGTLAIAGPINPGSYCVAAYDSGAVLEPVTYTLEISYP